MATLLSRAGVPIEEIVENSEWEDFEMCKTYVRSLEVLAVQRRNLSNVVFPVARVAAATTPETETTVMRRLQDLLDAATWSASMNVVG